MNYKEIADRLARLGMANQGSSLPPKTRTLMEDCERIGTLCSHLIGKLNWDDDSEKEIDSEWVWEILKTRGESIRLEQGLNTIVWIEDTHRIILHPGTKRYELLFLLNYYERSRVDT